MKRHYKVLAALGVIGVVGTAHAATLILPQAEITISQGANGDKPKLQRAGSNGSLVAVYGDSTLDAELSYDVKADAENRARDVYARYCTPSATKTCNAIEDWSTPVNVSKSADKSSIATDWQGDGLMRPFFGDVDKPNIKTSGPVMVVTWTSKYCPDGDLQDGVAVPVNDQNPNQRAIRYLERENRIIPFSCMWAAYSLNNGVAWSAPIQLSNGERDAKQDSSGGTYDSVAKTGRFAFSWQEDPEGLQIGEADGPGDGASGANSTGGTDVWYTYGSVAGTPAVFSFAPPSSGIGTERAYGQRVSDNWELEQKFGLSGQISHVFDAEGNNLDGREPGQEVENGNAAAARPNIGMVGGTTILAWEETKGAEGLDSGKFIRYQAFAYDQPPSTTEAKAGCILSDPEKNARRVRFLTQGPSDAGPGGVNIAIFWKEGLFDKGGPSDIVVRRGMGGLQPMHMTPVLDLNCTTSVYAEAIALQHELGENISSRASELTVDDDGLDDDTEFNYSENALAHRGVLRGNELWIGYNYTNDLVKMWAQLDNYNFWVRKFTFDGATGGSWNLPFDITQIANKAVNVREPRFFGTPPSNPTACPSGDPLAPDTTDPSLCQARNTIFVVYGSQTNVSPFDPNGPEDLGIFITVSQDSGATFAPPVQYSEESGTLFGDDDYAFEAQPVAHPDGSRVYGVFNTGGPDGTHARYRAVEFEIVADPPPPQEPGEGGGGVGGTSEVPEEPELPEEPDDDDDAMLPGMFSATGGGGGCNTAPAGDLGAPAALGLFALAAASLRRRRAS